MAKMFGYILQDGGTGLADGGYADAQFALLHERVTNKGDADDVAQMQRDIAQLKRAIGPSIYAQQLQQDGPSPGDWSLPHVTTP